MCISRRYDFKKIKNNIYSLEHIINHPAMTSIKSSIILSEVTRHAYLLLQIIGLFNLKTF